MYSSFWCMILLIVMANGHGICSRIFFPLQTLVLIAANKPLMYWKLLSSRKFTIASAYNLIEERDWPSVSTKWKMVWEWNGLKRIRYLL